MPQRTTVKTVVDLEKERRAERLAKIVVEQIDLPRLKAYLDGYGKGLSEVAEGEDPRYRAIVDYLDLLDTWPNVTLVDCETCGAESDKDLLACPVCGEEGIEEEPPSDASGDEVIVADPSTITVEHAAGSEETALATVEDLDENVAKIKQFVTQAVVSSRDVGIALHENKAADLWKARKDASGNNKYRDLHEFVEAELPITWRYARSSMALSLMFDEKDFAEIGPGKLQLIGQVVNQLPEERARLLDKARRGTSLNELRKEAERILPARRERVSTPGGAGGGKAGRKSRAAASVPEPQTDRAPRKGEITVTFQNATYELKGVKGTGKEAHLVIAREEMLGGVTAIYKFDKKKELFTISYKAK